MSEEKSDLEKILGHHLIHKMETPPGGSPVVQFYRTRNNRFQFFRDRCRRCRRPPNVLFYDSRWGAVCDECHTREAAKRLEVILRLRRGLAYPLLESPQKEKPPAFFTRRGHKGQICSWLTLFRVSEHNYVQPYTNIKK